MVTKQDTTLKEVQETLKEVKDIKQNMETMTEIGKYTTLKSVDAFFNSNTLN